MKVLVACEFSGIVREAFRKRGHSALSVDLEPTEQPGWHHQGRIEDVLAAAGRSLGDGWYLLHSNDSIWLVCEKDRHRYRDAKKCTLVAEGPKKDLWPTFLTYAELMR